MSRAGTYGLTQVQQRVLGYIGRYIAEHDGVPPSFDEIMTEVGVVSKSGVHRIVTALEERGYIKRLHNRARTLSLVVDPPSSKTPFSVYLNLSQAEYLWLGVAATAEGKTVTDYVRALVLNACLDVKSKGNH
jgi:SOS-response transcriptional repressor LexA